MKATSLRPKHLGRQVRLLDKNLEPYYFATGALIENRTNYPCIIRDMGGEVLSRNTKYAVNCNKHKGCTVNIGSSDVVEFV